MRASESKIDNEMPPPLPAGISLRLYRGNGEVLFEDSGKWLHPLFAVEDFLRAGEVPASEIVLQDKIAGRAAASLIVRMGIRSCHIGVLSRLAQEVFERRGIGYSYETLVDRIQCRTEDLVSAEMDLDEIHRMLSLRAGRNPEAGSP